MSNVSDVKIKQITIKINGEEHHLRFTLNAFAELEEAYGTIDTALEKLNTGSIKAIRKLLWAGLLHENPDIKELDVGNMVDTSNIKEFSESLAQALTAAMPATPVPTKDSPNAPAQK